MQNIVENKFYCESCQREAVADNRLIIVSENPLTANVVRFCSLCTDKTTLLENVEVLAGE